MSDEQDQQRKRDAIRQRKRDAIRQRKRDAIRQRKRDELLDRAKRGELTGEEADAKAEKLGGPFSKRPDDNFRRSESLPHWTLTMVLVWILYRDLNKVREWDAEYCAECLPWVHGDAGWVLKRPPVPTLLRLKTRVAEAKGPKASMSVREAEEQLWAMLQKGSLKASGIDPTTGHHAEIPALDWLELVSVPQDEQNYPGKGDEVRRGRGGLGEGYRDVRVPSADVRSCFLAPGEKPIPAEMKVETPTREEQPQKRRGRKPGYDRDAIITELVRFAHKEGFQGKTKVSVSEYLAEWYADHNGGKGPAANTIRNYISRYFPDLPEGDDN